MKNRAFTLSEVLITLGIIGIVAAMTIPTLMNKAKYAELAGQFKKEYSTLSNAWSQIITENGGSVVGVFSSGDIALDEICTKVKCIKKCYKATGNSTDCLAAQSEIKSLDGVNDAWVVMYGSIGVLADGSTFWLINWTPACNSARNNNTTCSYLMFDTNGKKKPNTIGRDILELWLTQTKVVPTGADDNELKLNATNCNPAVKTYIYNGATCGAKILLEGGMNY